MIHDTSTVQGSGFIRDRPFVAFVASGEMEASLVDRVRSASRVVAVDGGLNHCDTHAITPNIIVGDNDSVDPKVLPKYKSVGKITLARAKAETDLQAALTAERVDQFAKATIFAALGKRIDHAIVNLFVLFKHPRRLLIETEHERIVAIEGSKTPYLFQAKEGQTLSLIPLVGTAQVVKVQIPPNSKGAYSSLDSQYPIESNTLHEGEVSVEVGEGSVMAVFSSLEIRSDCFPSTGDFTYDFGLKIPMARHFRLFQHLMEYAGQCQVVNDDTRLFVLNQKHPTTEFDSKRGQTISLLPIFGSVRNVVSEGLKWELTEASNTTFDCDFLGLSNISLGDHVHITVGQGHLLCIINTNLIDEEMVPLVDHSTTGNLCRTPPREIIPEQTAKPINDISNAPQTE